MKLLLLMACGAGLDGAPDPIEVRAWTVDNTSSGGVLVVQTSHEDGLTVGLVEPEVPGLTFSGDGLETETLGDRVVLTQRFRYTGKKGYYEVPPLVVSASDELKAQSLPLWIDLGKEAPNLAKIDDIVEPEAVAESILGWVLAGIGVVAVMVGGVFYAFIGALRRPAAAPKKRLPPDIRCLRAWEAVLADTSLDEDEKARELSRIFREYTEEVLQFPAVSWTTTEILARLGEMAHLPSGNLARAKKLLRVTDLVKYADVSPEGRFFEELDADLRAFVSSTRPRSWDSEEQADA